MNKTDKVKLLEIRLQILESNKQENRGVCRKLRREIRNMRKEADMQPSHEE